MLSVSLGYRCNNACAFCAQGSLRERVGDPEEAAVAAAIDAALARSPGAALAFTGGEPTLREPLPAWIAHARERGARWVLVQTNGRRLSQPGYADALARAGADAVEISLQGATAAAHDYLTATPGSFAQTVRGLALARSAGLVVSVTTVVTRATFRHLVDLGRLVHLRGATALRLTWPEPFGAALPRASALAPAPELVRPHVAALARHARAVGLALVLPGAPLPAPLRDRFAGLGDVDDAPPAP